MVAMVTLSHVPPGAHKVLQWLRGCDCPGLDPLHRDLCVSIQVRLPPFVSWEHCRTLTWTAHGRTDSTIVSQLLPGRSLEGYPSSTPTLTAKQSLPRARSERNTLPVCPGPAKSFFKKC